ncbi:MAG: C40 family peptidase [Rhizobiaceae bacterium]|nr:C40 family peptidase [Rhizobiaceae bacterium]
MVGHSRADDIISEARNWIGTPYVHQASVKGQGVDCLGLVRGVWRAFLGGEPEPIPPYSPDWGEVGGAETMLGAANRHFVSINLEELCPGDLIIFRWQQTAIAKHAGILTSDQYFIHAYERAGVVETTLGDHWRRRITAGFRFPNFQI